MPELPEVETTRAGIEPWLKKKKILRVIVRERKLRWPVPRNLATLLTDLTIQSVTRRAKYLLLHCKNKSREGYLLIHLGMSGALQIVDASAAPGKHDHLDILVGNKCLRFHDPRKFGSIHWLEDPEDYWLLKDLGPEPLGTDFTPDYLYRVSRKRKVAIKNLLMNSKIVVGIGNIYASEALFYAGLRPNRQAQSLTRGNAATLVASIRKVLRNAIRKGGTTLKDFIQADGKPGYFKISLKVYDREGLPCTVCRTPIKKTVTGQRSTFYCPACQK